MAGSDCVRSGALNSMELDRRRQLAEPEKRLEREFVRGLWLARRALRARRRFTARGNFNASRSFPAMNWHSAACDFAIRRQGACCSLFLFTAAHSAMPGFADRRPPWQRECHARRVIVSAHRDRKRTHCDIAGAAPRIGRQARRGMAIAHLLFACDRAPSRAMD